MGVHFEKPALRAGGIHPWGQQVARAALETARGGSDSPWLHIGHQGSSSYQTPTRM